jgi:hypothetical protein
MRIHIWDVWSSNIWGVYVVYEWTWSKCEDGIRYILGFSTVPLILSRFRFLFRVHMCTVGMCDLSLSRARALSISFSCTRLSFQFSSKPDPAQKLHGPNLTLVGKDAPPHHRPAPPKNSYVYHQSISCPS